MDFLTDPALIASFISLTALEIILGIDNVIFIALLVGHLPKTQRNKVRNIGIFLALFLRVGMLLGITWVIGLKDPIVMGFSGKDLMMLAGGAFLIYKAVDGIIEEMSGLTKKELSLKQGAFLLTISQIILIDLVFSFDSIMTAVGVTEHTMIIIAAMIIAMFVMLVASHIISDFIEKYPSLKILALAFIMLVGVLLVAEGFNIHFPKEYIYAAMGFSLLVETLNIMRNIKKRVH